MKLDIAQLFTKQAELDAHIQANHGLDYPSTRRRRILALLVELGELANETRAFKFWSLKGPSPKEKILDEYADGMHFFLSLGIDVGSKKTIYDVGVLQSDITEQVLATYQAVAKFMDTTDTDHFEVAFSKFIDLIPLLGATPDDAIAAYYQKLGVNYKRQQEKY